MELLLCANRDSSSQPALEYGVWLAALLKVPVVLLGIVERLGSRQEIEGLIAKACRQLDEQGLSYRTLIIEGSVEKVIAREAARGEYLTLVGFLGRSCWRRLWRGRSFRQLMDLIESPLLYVPSTRFSIRRILVCTGGLRYAEGVLHMVKPIAQASGACVTLLHITEPASLDFPLADELKEYRENLLESSTPQAQYIQQALTEFDNAGITVEMKHRRGYIVHEILKETQEVDYDMVGLGSQHGVETLRHLFTPNVSAEVVEAVDLPVLVVRYQHGVD